MACHQTGLPSHHHPADHQHQHQQQHQHHQHHHHPQQHQQLQLGHAAAAAAAAASMGMESSELVAVAHYQAQQLQRQLLAEQSGQAGTMLPPAATQPTGGGMTQPLQQGQHAAAGAPQSQGQDPLQSLMQQLICLQQIEYFLAQRGHK